VGPRRAIGVDEDLDSRLVAWLCECFMPIKERMGLSGVDAPLFADAEATGEDQRLLGRRP
jgi:hypothetical protein